MLRSLRNRLIFSHILPLIIVVPLMGILLIYVLESRVLLVNLSLQMRGQALLLAELARNSPGMWSDVSEAEAFVERTNPLIHAQLMLVDRTGRVLAAGHAADAPEVGQRLEHPGLAEVLNGEIEDRASYSPDLKAEVADVMVPARGPDSSILGVVRVTHHVETVQERFQRLRFVTLQVLGLGLLLGVPLGWWLALSLQRPIVHVTDAIQQFGKGQLRPVAEEGPEEVRLLAYTFNRFAERIQAAEEARRHLLANLVHELGRPLGALGAASQTLLRVGDTDAALRQELLTGINMEVQRLRRLLDNLADLYDRASGALELEIQPLVLEEWLPLFLAPLAREAQAGGRQWQLALPATLPTLHADPDRLAQAVGNLVSNAIKYSRTGDNVAVDVGATEASVWIRVSDTGMGIAPDEQVRIFDPFYRSRAATRFPQGMGLGLTIARDIAEAHGGRLEVQSAPGVGSSFTLWLPLTSPTVAAGEASPASL